MTHFKISSELYKYNHTYKLKSMQYFRKAMCIRVCRSLVNITRTVRLNSILGTHTNTHWPNTAATHPITINSRAQSSPSPGYRWFILCFIKETGVPLKRDQSATGHEESASNWPFIKKPSQVDRSPEISRVTTELHYINYAADEPPALWLTLVISVMLVNAQMLTHLDTGIYAYTVLKDDSYRSEKHDRHMIHCVYYCNWTLT